MRANGGYLTAADLAAHHSEWVEPVSTNYRGYDVWELPPNTQGVAALQMLNILEAYDLKSMGFGSAEYLHLFIEAKKLAFEDRARYYVDHTGLEVELIYIPTALQVTRVVLTGDSQIAFSGGAPVVSAVLSGADLVFVGGVANVPAFYMMALPEIKSVGDLKGKTVGVTRFGSSTDFALRYLVQKNGFNPDKDLNILQLGGMPELAAALSKRLIVAAPLSAPTHIRARAAGAQPLLDMAKAGVYFPHTAVITRRAYLKTNRETALNFFRGYSEGLQRFVQDKARRRKSFRSTLATPPTTLSKRLISTPSITWSARPIPIARASWRHSN